MRMIDQQKVIMGNAGRFSIVILILFVGLLWASGGYDHGTSTGKGKLQIDLTWNPFNYFENGQSYIVIGYGITKRLDIHGYYCDHGNYHNGVDSYYYGIFYQFLDSKYLDLATAFGKRKMMDLDYGHFFFPQLLYNVKLYNGFSLGGSFVNIKNDTVSLLKKTKTDWSTIDIAFFIPLTRYFKKSRTIEEVKIGIGTFRTGLGNDITPSLFMPTYSIDIKFKRFYKPK
jgi:hypothetical protein